MILTGNSMKSLLSKFSLATLFATLILLNLADATMTSILIFEYGINVEVNPILRELVQAYGIGALFGFKYFIISILGLLLLALKTDRRKIVASYALWFVNTIYVCIVIYDVILTVISINI